MKEKLEFGWLGQFPVGVLLLAAFIGATPARAVPAFLEPEQAFRLSVQQQGAGQVQLQWSIAPGYYLYRDRIGVSGSGVGAVTKPRGQAKEDPNFGSVEVYHDFVRVAVATAGATSLRVTWQGCAEEGLCYPPAVKEIVLAKVRQPRPAASPPRK